MTVLEHVQLYMDALAFEDRVYIALLSGVRALLGVFYVLIAFKLRRVEMYPTVYRPMLQVFFCTIGCTYLVRTAMPLVVVAYEDLLFEVLLVIDVLVLSITVGMTYVLLPSVLKKYSEKVRKSTGDGNG